MRQVLACTGGVELDMRLGAGLAEHDIQLALADDSKECVRQLRELMPEAVLLVVPPDPAEAARSCSEFRRESGAGMLALSTSYSQAQAVAVLDAGADDYAVLRENPEEIAARVRALLRRSARMSGHRSYNLGDLRIDAESRTVRVRDREARLTPLEFRLLTCLAANAGRSLSPGTLLKAVRGYALDEAEAAHIIRARVWRLRQQSEQGPGNPRYILNVRGSGYILERRGPGRRVNGGGPRMRDAS